MKTTTLQKNNSKILTANNRTVRVNGQSYLIRSQRLGPVTLADAEPLPQGGNPIDLFSRSEISRNIRAVIELGCFS